MWEVAMRLLILVLSALRGLLEPLDDAIGHGWDDEPI